MDVRKLAGVLFAAYQAQLKADEDAWREVFEKTEGTTDGSEYFDRFRSHMIDVQNLVLWVKSGMYFSRVPLGVTHCPCPICRKIHGSDYAFSQ